MLVVDTDTHSAAAQLGKERPPIVGAEDGRVQVRGYLIDSPLFQALDIVGYLFDRAQRNSRAAGENLVRFPPPSTEGTVVNASPADTQPVPAQRGVGAGKVGSLQLEYAIPIGVLQEVEVYEIQVVQVLG